MVNVGDRTPKIDVRSFYAVQSALVVTFLMLKADAQDSSQVRSKFPDFQPHFLISTNQEPFAH